MLLRKYGFSRFGELEEIQSLDHLSASLQRHARLPLTMFAVSILELRRLTTTTTAPMRAQFSATRAVRKDGDDDSKDESLEYLCEADNQQVVDVNTIHVSSPTHSG